MAIKLASYVKVVVKRSKGAWTGKEQIDAYVSIFTEDLEIPLEQCCTDVNSAHQYAVTVARALDMEVIYE
jgi:hypothetical protein